MKTSLFSACLAAGVVLCGCGVQRQPAPAKTFLMLTMPADAVPLSRGEGACLRLRPVNVQPAFSGTALMYRTGEHTWEKDYFNQFLLAPDQQVGSLLENWLRNSGAFDCPEDDADAVRLVLEPHLEALYVDMREAAAPAVYARIRFVVTRYDLSCRCSRIQVNESLESTIPLPVKPTPEAVVAAMGRAIADIVQRFRLD